MKIKVNNPLDFKVLDVEPERLYIGVGSCHYYVEAKRNSFKTELLLEDGFADEVVTLDSVSIDNGLAIEFNSLNSLNALRYFCICGLAEYSMIDTKAIKDAYTERMAELEREEIDALVNALEAFHKAKGQLEFMWRNRVKGCTSNERETSGFSYELPNGDVVKRVLTWGDAQKVDRFYVDMAKHIRLNLNRFKLGRRIGDVNIDDFLMMPGFCCVLISDKDGYAGFIESIFTNNYQHYKTFLNHMDKLKDAYYTYQNVRKKKERCFNTCILGCCDLD